MNDISYVLEGSKLTTTIKYLAPGTDGGDYVGRFKIRTMTLYNDEPDFLHIQGSQSKIPGNDQEYFVPLEFVEVVRHHYYKYLRPKYGSKDMCLSLTSKYIFDKRPSDPESKLVANTYFEEFKLRPYFEADIPGQRLLSDKCKEFFSEIYRRKQICRERKEKDKRKIVDELMKMITDDVKTGNSLRSSSNSSSSTIFRSLPLSSSFPSTPSTPVGSGGDSKFLSGSSVHFSGKVQRIEVPKMNILIMIVGTRGDVQPFVRLAMQLIKEGHRVRLATHDFFREYVVGENNLEFYPLAGDPTKLSEYIGKIQGKIIPNDWASLQQVWGDSYQYATCKLCSTEIKIGLLQKIKGFSSVLINGNKCTNPKCNKIFNEKEIQELNDNILESVLSQQTTMLLDIVESCWGACTKVGVVGLGSCKYSSDGTTTSVAPLSNSSPSLCKSSSTCGQSFHKKIGEFKHAFDMGICSYCNVLHPNNRTFCDERGNSGGESDRKSPKVGTSTHSFQSFDKMRTSPRMHSNIVESDEFIADAIISNPVTYGHIHCAEALGVPLHIMFPQPWLPTKAFPHPLANISYSSGWNIRNYVSYNIMDLIMFENLKSGLNDFRRRIGIDPLLTGSDGWHLLHSHKVPFVKMWSPWLAPKPKDWKDNVDVVGTFWDGPLWDKSRPPPQFADKDRLLKYLSERVEKEGVIMPAPKPIFVGFGSMVITDFTKTIENFVQAAFMLKVRVVFQGGWAKMKPEEFSKIVANIVNKCRSFEEDNAKEGEDMPNASSRGSVNGSSSSSSNSSSSSSSSGGGFWSSVRSSISSAYSTIVPLSPDATKTEPSSINLLSKGCDISEYTVEDWDEARDIILIGPVDHAWLFTEVAATVHHGGAGTTAQTLRAGLPTWILPFFGDQHFWGEIVHKRGLGPKPVPFAEINDSSNNHLIEEAFKFLLDKSTKGRAIKAGQILSKEADGVVKGFDAFYKHLPVDRMICDVSILMGKSKLAQVYCKTCRWKLCVEVSNYIHCHRLNNEKHEIIPLNYVSWSEKEPRNLATGITHFAAGTIFDILLNPSGVLNGNAGRDAEKLVTQLYEGLKNTIPNALRGVSLEKLLYRKPKAYNKHLIIPVDSRDEIRYSSSSSSASDIPSVYTTVSGGRKADNRLSYIPNSINSPMKSNGIDGKGGGALSDLLACSKSSDETHVNALADNLFDSCPEGGGGSLHGDSIIIGDERDEISSKSGSSRRESDVNISLPAKALSPALKLGGSVGGLASSTKTLSDSSDVVQDDADVPYVGSDDDIEEGDGDDNVTSPPSSSSSEPIEEYDIAYNLALTIRNNFDKNISKLNKHGDKDMQVRSVEISKFKGILAEKPLVKTMGRGGFASSSKAAASSAPSLASTDAVLTAFVESLGAGTYDFIDLTNIYLFFMEFKDGFFARQMRK